MKVLNIPEIGDELIVAEDIEVPIVPERRNESVVEGYHLGRKTGTYDEVWIKNTLRRPLYNTYDFPIIERYVKKFFGEPEEEYYRKQMKIREASSAYQRYMKDLEVYEEHAKTEYLSVYKLLLVKGTKLKVDRIYIRKGASDYSSVSFFLHDGSKKRKRFFLKLSDVTKIKFED